MLKQFSVFCILISAAQLSVANLCDDADDLISAIKQDAEFYYEKIRQKTFDHYDDIQNKADFYDLGNIGFREIDDVHLARVDNCRFVHYSFRSGITNKITKRRFSFFFDTKTHALDYTIVDWANIPLNSDDEYARVPFSNYHRLRPWQGYADGSKVMKNNTISFMGTDEYNELSYVVGRNPENTWRAANGAGFPFGGVKLSNGDYVKLYTNNLRHWSLMNIISGGSGTYRFYVNGEILQDEVRLGHDNEYSAKFASLHSNIPLVPFQGATSPRWFIDEIIIMRTSGEGSGMLYAFDFFHTGG